MINSCNKRIILYSLFLFLPYLAPNANAESALYELGVAHNTFYKESKKVRQNGSPEEIKSQLKNLENRTYSKANELIEKEHHERIIKFMNNGNKALQEVNRDLASDKSLANTKSTDKEDEEFLEQKQRIPSSVQTPVEGAAGATAVEFAQPTDNAPNMVDGIIQEN